MARTIDLDDLLDANAVADRLGLSSPTAVATYRQRYADFPAPVWASQGGRCNAWLAADIDAWARATGRSA